MTNRDFDQDDARELAEFAGYVKRHCDNWNSETYVADYWYDEQNEDWVVPCDEWKPWSLEAPMWQIQSLLDAVSEKGLEEEFYNEIYGLIEPEGIGWKESVCFMSAPPQAICSAILSMEVE